MAEIALTDDLSKFRDASDGLGFSAIGRATLTTPVELFGKKLTLEFSNGIPNPDWFIWAGGTGVWQGLNEATNTYQVRGVGGNDITFTGVTESVATISKIEVELLPVTSKLTIDGNEYASGTGAVTSFPLEYIGQSLSTLFGGMVLKKLTIDSEVLYDTSGQFGNTELEDSIGGNNATLINTTWNKIRNGEVVESYANATIYEAQLPEIPVEFQNVTDIQTDAPPTNDVFWGAYTDTWLVVSVQGRAFIYNLIENSEEIMQVNKTTDGATLSTGIANVVLAGGYSHPSHIKSVSTGILMVKYRNDSVFTPITVNSEGTFYPIGEIKEIDVDNSTVVIADIDLGFI